MTDRTAIAEFARYTDIEQLHADLMKQRDDELFGNQLINNGIRAMLRRLIEHNATVEDMKGELARQETARVVMTDVALQRDLGVVLMDGDVPPSKV